MRTLVICLLASASMAVAQDNPFSAFNKRAFGQMKLWILASAEKMPAENFSYKPTDSVRSFGQMLGHVADSQYYFCSTVMGEKNPGLKIEQTKTSKADLIPALKEAFAYCDKAYDTMTDAAASEKVKMFSGEMAKPVVLTVNDMHLSEHYGNLVTYMRMKNVVPPSSEPSKSADK